MNRGLSILFVAASLIVLAGCSISVEPFEPEATVVNAQPPSDDPPAVATGSLAPGESVFYRVNVPGPVATASEIMVYDLDVANDSTQNGSNLFSLRLYNTGGGLLASSVSHTGFTSGAGADTSSLSSTGALQPQGLSIAWQCLGPCIISPTPFDRYIRIENISNDAWAYSLFAFGEVYSDTNETNNNTESGATSLSTFDEGAIETIGDVDFYRVQADGELFFDSLAAASLGLRAEVSGPGGPDELLLPGESVFVVAGDLVEVYSSTNWAGSPQASGYSLEIP